MGLQGTSTGPPQPQPLHDYPYTEKELEAIIGPEGGGGWFWADYSQQDVNSGSTDDPMEVISQVKLAKVSMNLWQHEEIKPERGAEMERRPAHTAASTTESERFRLPKPSAQRVD